MKKFTFDLGINVNIGKLILLNSLMRIYIKDDRLDYRNEKLLAYVMTRKWTHLIEREYAHAICIHCAGVYDP